MSDDQETPRSTKRRRDFGDTFHFSPTPSSRSESTASVTSHKSGELNPVKQIHALKQLERPVVFCDFNSVDADSQRSDVAEMRKAVQTLAEGIGILDYDNEDVFNASIAELDDLDRSRLKRPWSKDARRAYYGSTPVIRKIARIVNDAIALNTGAGGAEDEWNSDVQKPLLKLALATSRHSNVLSLHSVQTARIDPPTLSNSIPGRIIDYVICLKPELTISNAYRTLRPLAPNTLKSWNHVTSTAQDLPFAIHIETKSPMKSWTDGKPQIGVWIDAWLRRCELLWKDGRAPAAALVKDWPAIPVLISQGHEWHLLVVTKSSERTIISEQIMIGNTRNVCDALKVVAVLHWLLDWAETVWRPWFLELIDKEET